MAAHPLDWIDDELDSLSDTDLLRAVHTRTNHSTPGMITIDGREVVNFSNNDYLGIAADLSGVISAESWGSGASPLITGYTESHQQLEQQFADFKHSDAAVLFSTGFAANMGTIPAVVGEGDAIFSDARNHASIIDGCRLAKAQTYIYRHNDIDHLSALIQNVEARRKLIVSDSLFSMDGDIADLPNLAQIAEESDAMLMIDEAHATGLYGKGGHGLVEEAGIESGVHITVSTFSKALGSIGGIVTGSQQLIDLLRNRARSYVFSTALPAAVCDMSLRALQIVEQEPQRRERLFVLKAMLVELLASAGLICKDHPSHIIPIRIGDNASVLEVSVQLLESGFLVAPIRPPTVPVGESMVRIGLSASHSSEQVEELARAILSLLS